MAAENLFKLSKQGQKTVVTCGTGFCGEIDANQCPCGQSVMPSRVNNFFGSSIPDKLYSQLEGIHKRLQAKATPLPTLVLTDKSEGMVEANEDGLNFNW